MRKWIIAAVAILAGWGANAQQTIKSEEVSKFSQLNLSGAINVELIPAEKNAIDVVLTNTDINKFKWNVSDGVMNVSLRATPGQAGSATMKIYYADELSAIKLYGGQLITKDTLQAHLLRLAVSGGATMTATLRADDLELDVTSNSVVQLSGAARYLTLRATDKSRVDTRPLEAISVETDTATGAEVYVSAKERFVSNAKTNSSVFYKGTPTIIKQLSPKMGMGVGASVLNIGE